jgi:hypothetical protein
LSSPPRGRKSNVDRVDQGCDKSVAKKIAVRAIEIRREEGRREREEGTAQRKGKKRTRILREKGEQLLPVSLTAI